jgi:Icc-related predicted phosphoesterase
VIRVAAVADVHFGVDAIGTWRPELDAVCDEADVLVIAGDLTRVGMPEEAEALVAELEGITLPIVTVLGNHDFHADCEKEITRVLESSGVHVLEGSALELDLDGGRLGVAGVKGFGLGFPGAEASDFGEPEMKAYVRHAHDAADRLRDGLTSLATDHTVAVMHYSPVEATLDGERREIWPFLGSHLLADAVDEFDVDLVVHGHAHAGTEHGTTPGGTPVRNVAQSVIRSAFRVYEVG